MATPRLRILHPDTDLEPQTVPVRRSPASVPFTLCAIIASDLLALACAAAISVAFWYFVAGKLEPGDYLRLWPILAVFLTAQFAAGLYPGIALNPVEELRRATASVSVVYASLGSVTFLLHDTNLYSRAVFLLAWMQTLVLVPLMRSGVRWALSHHPRWGYPVLVIGSVPDSDAVIALLLAHPDLGLKPVAALESDSRARRHILGVPVCGGLEKAPLLARQWGIRCAIVAMPALPRARLLDMLARHGDIFSRLIVMPELEGMATLWVKATDLGGKLGLEVRQSLLLPAARFSKRAIDVGLTVALGVLLAPLLLLIALAIKVTSRGPVLYGHLRYGREGRPFTVWKFRSMVWNADEALGDYLSHDSGLAQEWSLNQKLRSDPRITPVGRLLRKTSLDEAPQLWNVLLGDMSLVGPRPIVESEIGRYGDKYHIYKKMMPGLTGLWQVSGRSRTDYAQRVSLDMYYVSNWSIWLDIHILARTVKAVLFGEGAC
jgi:Undecaprenyl-phosphate galactose phosphotransferase WbaP